MFHMNIAARRATCKVAGRALLVGISGNRAAFLKSAQYSKNLHEQQVGRVPHHS